MYTVYLISVSRSNFGNSLFGYAHSQTIGKSNNLIVVGAMKTKGLEKDRWPKYVEITYGLV